VETVQKISKAKQSGPILPLFKSDASKVTSKGMGLKKAYLGKQNQFTVNAGDAGTHYPFYQSSFEICVKVCILQFVSLYRNRSMIYRRLADYNRYNRSFEFFHLGKKMENDFP